MLSRATLGMVLIGLAAATVEAAGTVNSETKISDTVGGFGGVLGNGDQFGFSVTALGDLDQNGVGDLAVGANHDDDGGEDRGFDSRRAIKRFIDFGGRSINKFQDRDLFAHWIVLWRRFSQ